MREVTGKGCHKNNAPVRYDLTIHDVTDGNIFVPLIVKDKFASKVNASAIDAGLIRVENMLKNADTLNMQVTNDPRGYNVAVEIIN